MGKNELKQLLENLKPKAVAGDFYFACVDESQLMAIANFIDYVVAIFREDEGLTIVFSGEVKNDFMELTEKPLVGPFSIISMGVESDLMAVGLLAKITTALAKENISVNAFSAYHHDHILVPAERKGDAVRVLNQLKSA